MKTRYHIFIIPIFIFSCGENKDETNNDKSGKGSSINDENSASSTLPTTLDKDLHPYTDFTYAPVSGGEYFTDRGTKITIPKNTFVYMDGKPVNENVKICFREFLTPGEIIISGIPMEFDSAGIKKQFQSAGMFEIRAFVNDEPVEVAEGKSVEVELASTMDGDFNFYKLDDNTQNWGEIAKAQKSVPNERKKKKEKKLDKKLTELKKPVAPKAYKPGDLVFDININTQIFPDFKELNGLMWQYAGTDPKKDPVNNKSFFASEWNVVRISPLKDNKYRINFQKDKDTASLIAVPIYQGSLLTNENTKFKAILDNYNTQYNAIMSAKFQNEKELALLRKFNLESMGIYNYDRYYHNPEAVPLLALFDFGVEINLATTPVSVFLVPRGENAVIRYVPSTYDKFGFDPTKNNMLIAVLPDNSICTYGNSGFKKIRRDPKGERQRFMFSMNYTDERISNPQDIDNMLAKNE